MYITFVYGYLKQRRHIKRNLSF